LRSSDRVVICGYRLSQVDQRARDLLLRSPRKSAQIVVASGGDTSDIVNEFRREDFSMAGAAGEVFFQNWVANTTEAVAALR
jgi:hypothetical protein